MTNFIFEHLFLCLESNYVSETISKMCFLCSFLYSVSCKNITYDLKTREKTGVISNTPPPTF